MHKTRLGASVSKWKKGCFALWVIPNLYDLRGSLPQIAGAIENALIKREIHSLADLENVLLDAELREEEIT